jgi:hypothetical protein
MAKNILIQWNPSADNVGIKGYELEIDGVVRVLPNITSYLQKNAANNTTFTYRIRSFDFAQNYSDWSAPVSYSTAVFVIDGTDTVIDGTDTVIEGI